MSRKEQVERIVLGTLLNDFGCDSYFRECRMCVTPDMFSDRNNGLIYSKIADMHAKGMVSTTPYDMLREFPELLPQACYMAELATEWDFTTRKCRYNSQLYYSGSRRLCSDASFGDYVSRFIQLTFGK